MGKEMEGPLNSYSKSFILCNLVSIGVLRVPGDDGGVGSGRREECQEVKFQKGPFQEIKGPKEVYSVDYTHF